MPVWGVWLDDTFYFSTGRKSRKGRNLAANAACTITNDDAEDAVIVEGSAEEVKDAAALESGCGGLHEEVQDGSARHGRTDLCSAPA